jgi:antitoxin (DNA-binding transcriptional repressor) of toxin-antitoxin stability system
VITRHDRPVARVIPEGRPALDEFRDAANELRSLRAEMAKRRSFKPLSDREIKDAIEADRP